MKKHRRNALLLVGVLASAALVGCSSSSDGNVVTQPPADVTGVWTQTYLNAGSAILTGCTGDFTALNGLTMAGLLAASSCSNSSGTNPPTWTITQNGSSFTFDPLSYTCTNGDSGTLGGGGTVSGSVVTGQVDTISQVSGFTGSDFFSGSVTSSTTIAASGSHFSASGSIQGSCNISPALSTSLVKN